MNRNLLIVALVLATSQTSCKIVNTHIFKVTGSPEIGAEEVRFATTTGYLHLSAENLNDARIELLKTLRPFQCLIVRTSEPFDMNSRIVQFREFKLNKLVESDKECRKIKNTTRFSVR